MAALNPARFKINATPSVDGNGDKIYRAKAGEVLTFTLEDNPSSASSVTYSIFDHTVDDCPKASITAINLDVFGLGMTFTGGVHLTTLSSPNSSTAVTMYDGSFIKITGPMSWVIRCDVTMPDGKTYRYERGVGLLAFPDNFREPVYGEQDQFYKYGWGFKPLGSSMYNSFPQQSRYGSGSLNAISFATVDIVPSTQAAGIARTLVAVAQVWGREDGGATQALWGLRRVAFVDVAGVVTLSTNAGGETLDGTVLEARFQPSIVLNGTNVSVRMDQKVGGHSYDWKCWYTLMEAAE